MDKDYVSSILKAFTQLYPEASGIAIAFGERFIHFESNNLLGFSLDRNMEVLDEPITSRALINKEKTFGIGTYLNVTYHAISVPLIIHESLVGAVTVFHPHHSTLLSMPYLTVRTSDRWLPIHYDQVIFMEAQNRKTHIISHQGSGTHRSNLTELEQVLPKDIFFRCHRSYIINIHQIKEIHPDSHSTFILNMTDQSRVPVSQNYSKEIRKRFGF